MAAQEFIDYRNKWSSLRCEYYTLQKNLYFGWEDYRRKFSSDTGPLVPPNFNLDWDNLHEHVPDWLFMPYIPVILDNPQVNKWLCPFNDPTHAECHLKHKEMHLNGKEPVKFTPYIMCHAESLWLVTKLADNSISCSRISFNSKFYGLLCKNFILSRVVLAQPEHVSIFTNIGCRHCIVLGNFIVLKIVDFIPQIGFPMLYHLATGYNFNRNSPMFRCTTCVLKKRCKFNLFNMSTHVDCFRKCTMCGENRPCKHRRLIHEIMCNCENSTCTRYAGPPSLINIVRMQHRTLIDNNLAILPKCLHK